MRPSGTCAAQRADKILASTSATAGGAREIQEHLLPDHPPVLPGFDIAGASSFRPNLRPATTSTSCPCATVAWASRWATSPDTVSAPPFSWPDPCPLALAGGVLHSGRRDPLPCQRPADRRNHPRALRQYCASPGLTLASEGSRTPAPAIRPGTCRWPGQIRPGDAPQHVAPAGRRPRGPIPGRRSDRAAAGRYGAAVYRRPARGGLPARAALSAATAYTPRPPARLETAAGIIDPSAVRGRHGVHRQQDARRRRDHRRDQSSRGLLKPARGRQTPRRVTLGRFYASPCWRSAHRSAASSRPTETRKIPGPPSR